MRPLLPLVSVSTALVLAACGAPAPSSVAIGPEAPTTVDDLAVTIGGSSSIDGHRVEWTVDGTRRYDLQDKATVPASQTAKGQEWSVSVAVMKGGSIGDVAEAAVTILNTPPTATLELGPASPRTADPIRATVTREDIDNGAVDVRMEWRVDGSLTAFTGRILPAEMTSKGEVWDVTAIPFDDEGDGESVSLSTTIANTPPRVARAAIDPAFPTGAAVLSCVGNGWDDADDDAPQYTTEWLLGAEVVATTDTLAASDLTRGDAVQCRLTPTDGTDTGTPVTSQPETIRNAVPTIGTASITPDPATRLDALSVTLGDVVDFDDDPVTVAYAWSVNGRRVSTEETLAPRYFFRDDQVTVTVTPNDGFANGPVTTSAPVTVGNTPPTISTLTVTPANVYTDTVMTATSKATDIDRDTVTITTEWFVNGVSAGTGPTLDGSTEFDKGDTIYVEVTPSDGDDGPTVTSSTITVLNTAPTSPVVGLDPEEPEIGDEAVCVISTASTDLDLDTVSYTFEWQKDGTTFSGTTTTTYAGDTIPSGTTADEELYKCIVTPNDGTVDGVADTAILSYRTGPFDFTNCGQTGNTGPSQSQCDTAYTDTALDSQVTVTGGKQVFTVPLTATYTIEAAGAEGQSGGTAYRGGYGAYIKGTFDLTAGDDLTILVAQRGMDDACSGGGGGASFVLDSSGDALLVAGGGAGTRTSVAQDGCDGRAGEYAGTGSASGSTWGCGAKTSGLGAGGVVSSSSWGSAGGGMTSNGAVDSSCSSGGCGGYAPSNGGNGGGSSTHSAYGGFGAGGGGNGSCGGGGGGGYSGGDGGFVAGGGGSYNDGTDQTNSAGSNKGHGYVTITKISD